MPRGAVCRGEPIRRPAFVNAAWNSPSFRTTVSISSSGGRMVVRKCQVPGSCPKPEPGTTQMPVSSRSARQYSRRWCPAGA